MEELSFQDAQQLQKKPSKKGLRNIFILFIIILLLAGLAYGGNKFLKSKNSEAEKSEITPTPTEFQFPTDTPTPELSPAKGLTPTSTPKPTINPVDKATGLDRSDLSIEIQNGSGEHLVGSKGSEVLKGFGYHVVTIGNADNFNYENTVIKIKEDKSKYLSLLKKDLSSSYTIGTTSTDLSASSSADALVIIGKQ